jgi:hypothetical protein
VVLNMRRLATVRQGDRLHVIGPPPAGLEDEPTDLTVAEFNDLGSTIRKRAGFIGRLKAAVFCRLHELCSPSLTAAKTAVRFLVTLPTSR